MNWLVRYGGEFCVAGLMQHTCLQSHRSARDLTHACLMLDPDNVWDDDARILLDLSGRRTGNSSCPRNW